MFQHAYRSYREHAFPKDELRPVSCKGEPPPSVRSAVTATDVPTRSGRSAGAATVTSAVGTSAATSAASSASGTSSTRTRRTSTSSRPPQVRPAARARPSLTP
ncbi:MAG: glycoside hydrolase family 47 protein [Nitriliruptoraceae bacterium]